MKKKIRAVCFLAVWILGITLLGGYYLLAAPRDSAYSEAENRTLTGLPEFSLESLFGGTYTQAFESWLLDHFPGRNQVIAATNKIQGALSMASHEEYLLIAEGPQDLLDTEVEEEDLEDLINQFSKLQ